MSRAYRSKNNVFCSDEIPDRFVLNDVRSSDSFGKWPHSTAERQLQSRDITRPSRTQGGLWRLSEVIAGGVSMSVLGALHGRGVVQQVACLGVLDDTGLKVP